MDAKQSLGEPRLLISRSALLHNAGLIRRALPQGTRICAILKADAYGHGASIVADAAVQFLGRSIGRACGRFDCRGQHG